MELKRKESPVDLDELAKNKKLCVDMNDLICPITKLLFCMPISANDGFTYEKWALDNIMSSNGKSPITREEITQTYENKFVSNFIKTIISENPELKDIQFDGKCYYDYSENKRMCKNLLYYKKFKQFSDYNEIFLTDSYESTSIIEYVTTQCTDSSIILSIIKKSVDFNTSDIKGNLPIYYVVKNCSCDLILSVIDTKCDQYIINENKDSLIHLIGNIYTNIKNNISQRLSEDSVIEIMKYLIDHDMYDLEYKNKSGETQLNAMVKIGPRILAYFIGKLYNNFNENISTRNNNIFSLLLPSTFTNIVYVCDFDTISNFLEIITKIFNENENASIEIMSYFHAYYLEKEMKYVELYSCLGKILDDLDDNGTLTDNNKKDIAEKVIYIYKKNIRVKRIADDINTELCEHLKDDDKARANDILSEIVLRCEKKD